MEIAPLALICGKSNGHHLEPDGFVALTVEAAAMARALLAGAALDSRAARPRLTLSGRAGRS